MVECFLFIALLIAGLLVYYCIYAFERPLPYAVGLVTGCAVSGMKILLIDNANSRAVDMGKHAKNYATLQAMLRYFGTAAAVAPAFIFRGAFGVFGVIAGLLSLQLAAFITSIIIRRKA